MAAILLASLCAVGSSTPSVNVVGAASMNVQAPTPAGASVAASTTRQLTQLSLTLNPSSPTAGQTTTFSGTLKTTQNPAPLSNANVDLHVSTDNTNWSLVSGTSTNTTAATGAYTFSQSLSPGTYYFRTYYDGTSQYREAFSPTVKVTI